MSSPSLDAFPDLHHKMSKKIAQLTKVIYHLNTRNEDHQSELDAIVLNHQSEVQELIRDATNKIGKFKGLVDIRKAMVKDGISNRINNQSINPTLSYSSIMLLLSFH